MGASASIQARPATSAATGALSPQDAVLGFAVLLAVTVALVSRRLLGRAARA